MRNSKSTSTYKSLCSALSKTIADIHSSFLYKNVLPKMGITKVHYRCDGAGAFDSIIAKSAIGLWSKITDGELSEVTYKVMVAGCGKVRISQLDKMYFQYIAILMLSYLFSLLLSDKFRWHVRRFD